MRSFPIWKAKVLGLLNEDIAETSLAASSTASFSAFRQSVIASGSVYNPSPSNLRPSNTDFSVCFSKSCTAPMKSLTTVSDPVTQALKSSMWTPP